MIRYNLIEYEMVTNGIIWYDTIWYECDMMWYKLIWCDVIWFDTICFDIHYYTPRNINTIIWNRNSCHIKRTNRFQIAIICHKIVWFHVDQYRVNSFNCIDCIIFIQLNSDDSLLDKNMIWSYRLIIAKICYGDSNILFCYVIYKK